MIFFFFNDTATTEIYTSNMSTYVTQTTTKLSTPPPAPRAAKGVQTVCVPGGALVNRPALVSVLVAGGQEVKMGMCS